MNLSYEGGKQWMSALCMQVTHPFQFLDGVFTENLYDEQVNVCAQSFSRDATLTAKVRDVALAVFAKLEARPEACQVDTEDFMYAGVKFTVSCGRARDRAFGSPPGSGSQASSG